MSIVLEAKHINKYFKKPVLFHVLKDISFKIKKGEFAIYNGKIWLWKIYITYIFFLPWIQIMKVNLFLNNELITGTRPDNNYLILRNKHIGFVFQFHYLLSEFSVLENVCFLQKN